MSLTTISFFVAGILGCSALPPFARDEPEPSSCGYQSCNPVKEGFLNIHLVPHSHDDVGWKKTVDQYFYGARSDIQKAGVQYIIDTVIDSLRKDENRRFIYVETAFFWKWWVQQNDEIKEFTRKLVNAGRLEFIGGGWCMNDEAATHYHSIIDQMAWGLKKLNDSFGQCGRPRTGWQIDPFGHSRGMALIFAQLGFDSFLLNRIDYQELEHRKDTDSLEMVWRSSSNLGQESDIFTSILPKHYHAPSGFCFDITCNDEPIIDDPESPDNNVDQRVTNFLDFAQSTISSGLVTNNLLVTMGGDFNYQNAESWFKNLDKLIFHANQRQESGSMFNVLYSTPSCYVKAVYDESKGKINWPVKHDDFMPYASDDHSYWTGYFTSRPTLKRFEREGNNFLQICKQLSSLAGVDSTGVDKLREAMGVLQHHDAVTGTEKQAVANDYSRILSEGINSCESVVASALSKISTPLETPQVKDNDIFVNCPLLNISQCAFSENNDEFVVTVYNPLSRPVTKFVRLPVLGENYSVRNSNGQELANQLQKMHEPVLNIPGRESSATNELIFAAVDVPPLGFESFFVQKVAGYAVTERTDKLPRDALIVINTTTGLLTEIEIDGVSVGVTQLFGSYDGFSGNNDGSTQRASGAYVFRPTGPSSILADSVDYGVYSGNLVTEIHQVFNEYVSQVIRLYPAANYVEFQWLVGPIPDNGVHGQEVISLFKTDLSSNAIFYTDANGREMIQRVRNSRPTFDVNIAEEASGNYYPVTSKILLKDEEKNIEFAVLNDRAQGGTSLTDGEVELMIHRKCLNDDDFGVGESLLETTFGQGLVARGTHYVVVGPIESSDAPTAAAIERDLAQRKLLDSWLFLSTTEGKTFEEYSATHTLKYEGLTRALPNNVQILTLEPWQDSSLLLRLEHVLEGNEDPNLSQLVTVDLNQLFSSFEILWLEEATLGGNQLLKDNERLVFDEGDNIENMKVKKEIYSKKWTKGESVKNKSLPRDDIDNLQIDLSPMQIRTFIVTVSQLKM